MIGYKLVSDVTVSNTTTSITFSGLNITAADKYLLVADWVNGVAGNVNMNMTANGLVATNFYRERITGDSTSLTAYRSNDATFVTAPSGGKVDWFTQINLTNSGYIVFHHHSVYNSGTIASTICEKLIVNSTAKTSAISTLTLTSLTSFGIGVGSRFRLYKLTAKLVSDITVGSVVSTVSMTGLNINSDNEYLLIADLYNSGASTFGLNICVNNNNDSGYYCQNILANNSTIIGGRYAVSNCGDESANTYNQHLINIKLTNNGYFQYQSQTARSIGTNIMVSSTYGGSTFTLPSITSIAMISTIIGIGSRFQLYKLK